MICINDFIVIIVSKTSVLYYPVWAVNLQRSPQAFLKSFTTRFFARLYLTYLKIRTIHF